MTKGNQKDIAFSQYFFVAVLWLKSGHSFDLLVSLVYVILGMIISGSSQVVIFGLALVPVLAAVGGRSALIT